MKTRLFLEYAIDRTKRIARVSAYCGVVTLVLGTIATRRVYGSVEKSALDNHRARSPRGRDRALSCGCRWWA